MRLAVLLLTCAKSAGTSDKLGTTVEKMQHYDGDMASDDIELQKKIY